MSIEQKLLESKQKYTTDVNILKSPDDAVKFYEIPDSKLFVVIAYGDGCGHCKANVPMMPELIREKGLRLGFVESHHFTHVLPKSLYEQIQWLPTIFLIQHNQTPKIYEGRITPPFTEVNQAIQNALNGIGSVVTKEEEEKTESLPMILILDKNMSTPINVNYTLQELNRRNVRIALTYGTQTMLIAGNDRFYGDDVFRILQNLLNQTRSSEIRNDGVIWLLNALRRKNIIRL